MRITQITNLASRQRSKMSICKKPFNELFVKTATPVSGYEDACAMSVGPSRKKTNRAMLIL